MVTVPPGPPASLRAARPGQLENLAASDSASDDRGRQLLSGLVLEFADANGVPCSKLSLRGISGDQGGALGQPPPPPPVRCRIVADAGAEEDGDYDERGAGGSKAGRVEEVPRLEGADALGGGGATRRASCPPCSPPIGIRAAEQRLCWKTPLRRS